jgi:hypothetical protein
MSIAMRFLACFIVNIAVWSVPLFGFGVAFHPLVSLFGSAVTMFALMELSFVAIPD